MVHENGFSLRGLRIEKLDVRRLMAFDVLEVEPNNSESQSTRFEFTGADVRLLGTSTSKDDKDYFVFTAVSDQRIQIAATGGAKVEVNTGSGTQVFESEPNHGLTSGSWLASAGDTYRLRMRAPERASTAYEVLLSTGQGSSGSGTEGSGTEGSGTEGSGTEGSGSSGGSTNVTSGREVEPNNRPVLATSVVLSKSAPVTLSGTASKRDRDFFRVQTDSAGTVTIDTGNSGIKVSLETSSGAKLFESEPQDGITRGSFDLPAGSVFFVRARGTASEVTEYSLAITLAGATSGSSSGTTVGTVGGGAPSATVRDAWLDASDDGIVSPIDALMVINYINAHGQGHSVDDALLGLDTNDDRAISALDVLLVVNRINLHGSNDVNESFDDSDIRKRSKA